MLLAHDLQEFNCINLGSPFTMSVGLGAEGEGGGRVGKSTCPCKPYMCRTYLTDSPLRDLFFLINQTQARLIILITLYTRVSVTQFLTTQLSRSHIKPVNM